MYILTAQITDLVGQASAIMSGFYPAIMVAIAIPLGFYVGKKIIGLFPKK